MSAYDKNVNEFQQLYQMVTTWKKVFDLHDVDKSKWQHRKGVPSPEYDILLSLLVPEPELNLVEWDIENSIQHILQPFLDELGDLYSFTGIYN